MLYFGESVFLTNTYRNSYRFIRLPTSIGFVNINTHVNRNIYFDVTHAKTDVETELIIIKVVNYFLQNMNLLNVS